MGRGRSFSSGSRGSSFSSSSRGSSRSSSSRGVSRSSSSRSYGRSSFSSTSRRSSWSSPTYRRTTVYVGSGYGSSGHTNPFAIYIIFAVIFLMFGILMLIPVSSAFTNAFKYGSVNATCLSNDNYAGWYYTIYEYDIDGVEYISRSDEGWELPEDVGATVTIYYLKSDPYTITENKPFTSGDALITLFCVIFNGIGAMFIVLAVKYKKKQNSSSVDTTIAESTENEENDVKCLYCGSKYSKSLNSCPKCGAGKH